MKTIKLIALAFLFTPFISFAQITLENTYDSIMSNDNTKLYHVKLDVSGDKYVKVVENIYGTSNRKIVLYDMNHSIWKTIDISALPVIDDGMGNYVYYYYIFYLSENLFNTDSNVEFIYYNSSGSAGYLKVINELGVEQFSSDSAYLFVNSPNLQDNGPIFNSTAGTKMILHYFGAINKAKVFSLPGTYTGIQPVLGGGESFVSAFPNPTNGQAKLDYKFPTGITTGIIKVYDSAGNLMKSFNVDNSFDNVLLSTADVNAGTYFYSLETTQSVSTKKLVVVK